MRVIAGAALSALALAVAAPAIVHAADVTDRNSITVYTQAAELVVVSGEVATVDVTVELDGPDPATLEVELVDLAVGDDGEKILLPLSSTRHSLDGLVAIAAYDRTYEPAGWAQTRVITVSAGPTAPSDLAYGGLRFTLRNDGGVSTTGVAAQPSIVISLAVGPEKMEGYPEQIAPQISAHELTVRPLVRSSFVDALIPDIPGVINYGPVTASLRLENNGSLPAFTTVTWVYRTNGERVAELRTPERLVIADQKVTETSVSSVTLPGADQAVNPLPMVGVVSVEADVQSALGGQQVSRSRDSITVVILPWKEAMVTVLVAALAALGLWRYRRRRDEPSVAAITPTKPVDADR